MTVGARNANAADIARGARSAVASPVVSPPLPSHVVVNVCYYHHVLYCVTKYI